MANKVGRIASWTIGILILLIILLPLAMYIPWVQNKAKDIACHYVKEKTGMDLSVGKVLIKFPLDISLDDVKLLDKNGDTMVVAKNFTAGVAVRPLLDKRFKIDGAELTEGKYRLVSEDSSMILKADLKHCKLTGADIDLDNNKINVLDGELTGGNVHLSMYPYKKIQEQDTTKSEPWLIQAKHLALNDVDYTMEMLPTIDKLSAHVERAELKNGVVDTGAHTVDAEYLGVDDVNCNYTYPSTKWADNYNREHPIQPEIPPLYPDTIPWTVKADSIRLTGGNATYAQMGSRPGSGLDMNYIEVKDLNFGAKDFYNRESAVSVDVKNFSAKERCGIEVKDAHGKVNLNSQDIQLNNFEVKTRNSSIKVDGRADMSLLGDDHTGSVKMTTDASIDPREVTTAMPSLAKTMRNIPSKKPIKIKGEIEGNTRNLDIKNAYVDIPGSITGKVSGNIKNITDPKKMSTKLKVDADVKNADFAKSFLDKDLQKKLNVKSMKMKGDVDWNGKDVDIRNGYVDIPGHIKTTLNGSVKNVTDPKKMQANVNFDADITDVTFATKEFLDKDLQKKFNVLPMKAKGNVKYSPNLIAGDVDMRLKSGGSLVGKGSYSLNNDTYNIDATAKSLPVKKLVPELDDEED